MSPYDDILLMDHHVSPVRRRMTMESRAAQFTPFAALSGYGEAVAETARLTAPRIQLSEDEQKGMSRCLTFALHTGAPVRITYFRHDSVKEGGSYLSVHGRIRDIDSVRRLMRLQNGCLIPLDDIVAMGLTRLP